ncbi:MAG: iron-containing alcohol dehydrogenase [Betaproteobacteria bacterium]|nr:iron-containing alcohol dehydrogenase [Betaproteobacteria bacterium]MDH5222766.1 iron-containing alcohol dehydrogenase [Betaproteobacteria bacterium]MDH5352741.1 iron-containing alcohol dehydrogenase [Betaproteobacteria bacterium]
MDHYAYLPLERVVFGKPAAQAVAQEVERIGAQRVFVVASRSLSRTTSVVGSLREALGTRDAGLFDECVAHTPWPSVIAAADAVRRAAPDLILAVGGGTPIDTVKILQLVLAHGVRVPEDLERLRVPELKAVKPSPVRQVAVPTTLSGAEFSNLGGGTDLRTRIKHSFMGPDIGPRSVILDPAMTLHTPAWLWLSTGIRGVDHAVEALCSVDAHPFCDGLALHALRLFAEGLPATQAAPQDLRARLLCQQASWLAGSTIARVNYGASHGIGHALGAAAGVPHGHTSCIMLAHVLRYNEPATAAKQVLVAEALGLPGKPAADAVAALVRALGQPATLREAGVTRAQLPSIAAAAIKNRWVLSNPQPIRSEADVMRLLEVAW